MSLPREHHLEVRRTARYVTVGADDGAPREVWFVLHGYGQLATQFIAPFASIAHATRLIVAPEALNRFYTVPTASAPASERPVGATWMTREERELEIADYVAYLDDLCSHVLRDLARERTLVRVLGFSQGVATAVRWIVRGHAIPDQLICWGGTLPPDVQPAMLRQVLTNPLRVIVGSRDDFATPEVVEGELRRLREGDVPHVLSRFDGGHTLSRTMLRTLADEVLSPRGGAVGR